MDSGSPWSSAGAPLGARFAGGGTTVEFRVIAPCATRVELWLYARPRDGAPIATLPMSADATGAWSSAVSLAHLRERGLVDFIYYGYRAWGPNWTFHPSWAPGRTEGFASDVDARGNRFNPNKLLLDPYALEVSHCPLTPEWRDWSAYFSGDPWRRVDTGSFAPKGIVIDVPSPDFGPKPARPFRDEIVYEVHLRGLTKNDPVVPAILRGTYAGAMAKVSYLAGLGVTAVEFQPIHEMQNGLNDAADAAEFHDYWGYGSVSFFAPCRRYAADPSPGGPTREWMAMVKAFHLAGIKVYLDVVYNHHREGNVDPETGTVGAIFSLRGLANQDYYEVLGDGPTARPPNGYEDDNGVGPNLNAAAGAVRDLVLASLTYYARVLGVDGFRFDLAAVLGNARRHGGYRFDPDDPDGILLRAARELPARPSAGGAGVDLIAEPYGGGPAAQEQGRFPQGWSEWNDRFRDTVRASQNKLGIVPLTPGALAMRIAGSDDLFRPRGRRPHHSVNYVVCHDGMTLRDLHSFREPKNHQAPPFGPSGGGRSAAEEMCWDHGGFEADQRQAERTSLALLALSAGVPMISGGCEMGRTLRGNNNAYNLDTVASWLDWARAPDEAELIRFTRRLLRFRRAHAALRPADFFVGADVTGRGVKDIAWYREDGREFDVAAFDDPRGHFLGFALDGVSAGDSANCIYVAYCAGTTSVDAVLPPARSRMRWYHVADTSERGAPYGYWREAGDEAPFDAGDVRVGARSLVVLVAR